jgi:DNA invertase Pin-like site-specific DNA recombinase
MSHHSTQAPIAHPYVRISHPDQRKGGGLERQTTANLGEFNRLFGFTLSKRIWVDDGVSAFRGLNATPDHELGKFLSDARKGLIRPGDCLVIENYDRLSRQDPWAAIGLVSELRSLCIHVGRLDRMKLLRYDSEDYGDFFEAAVEFMRGNSESRAKSMRNDAAWQRKRKAARDNGKTITQRLPAWIHEVDGRREAIPERAAAIRRIFQLAGSGYGAVLIMKKLAEEGILPFGKASWSRGYIGRILNDRRALGEFQPRRGRDGSPIGEPIKDYFPAVITEKEFYAARGGQEQRFRKRGRVGKHVNPFAGLLKNAREGDAYCCTVRPTGGNRSAKRMQRLLINHNAIEGRSKLISFPFHTFEPAVLSLLREIDPHEILNGDSGPDETIVLRGQLEGVETELAARKAFMEGKPFSPVIGQQILDLESRQRELSERLAEARQKAAHPLSESWGEAQTLLEALDAAPDPEDARLRLRAALRRIVEVIMLLVVPRGRDRLCYVQIWFAGGERHRDYLIFHRPPKANASSRTEGSSRAKSFTDAGQMDLRRRDHVARLEKVLTSLSIENF